MALGESRHGRYRATLAKLQPRMERLRTSGDSELYGLALWFGAIAEGRLGRHLEAERMYARLVDVRRAQAGTRARSMQLAWALSDHGGALLTLGEAARGRAQLEQAARMFGELGGANHPHRQAPLIRLARHELALGRWQQARDLAQPAYAALLPATDWQNWTIYAALTAMPAHARLGDAASARAIMAAFDEMAMQGLDRDFPYLREDHWTGYAATWLALGEPAKAKEEIERLRSLLREPDASQLLPAKLACFDAELALANGDTGAVRPLAQRCRDRYAAVLPAASPLLAWPDRLLSKTVVSKTVVPKAGLKPAAEAPTAAP